MLLFREIYATTTSHEIAKIYASKVFNANRTTLNKKDPTHRGKTKF